MTDNPEKTGWTEKAALTDCDIGSTAITAAVLYGTRRKEQAQKRSAEPSRPQDAPETD